jgi:hypothetical protein
MMKQMTVDEREGLLKYNFDELWTGMWNSDDLMSGDIQNGLSNTYRQEELTSRSKFGMLVKGVYFHGEMITMEKLVTESYEYTNWTEPEWGFPKGRRNYQENEYEIDFDQILSATGSSVQLATGQVVIALPTIVMGISFNATDNCPGSVILA